MKPKETTRQKLKKILELLKKIEVNTRNNSPQKTDLEVPKSPQPFSSEKSRIEDN